MSSSWKELDKLLQKATEDVGRQPATEQDVQLLIHTGIMNLLEPVFAVFDKLREANVLVPGASQQPSLVPTGATLRTLVCHLNVPIVTVNLDRSTVLSIRVATRTDVPYPEVITTAKWRCVLTGNRHEIENRMFDNRDAMALWIFTQVLNFSNRSPRRPTPVTRPQVDPDADDQSSREHRVIMVDDPTQ